MDSNKVTRALYFSINQGRLNAVTNNTQISVAQNKEVYFYTHNRFNEHVPWVAFHVVI